MITNAIHHAKWNQALISNVFIVSPTGVITVEHRISDYITTWRNQNKNN